MKVEIRAEKVIIDGYVNAVGRDSRPLISPKGRFIERVEPQTFQRALDRAKNVELRLNHKRSIGSTADGSLSLYEDNIGLRAHAEISDPEVVEKAKKRELRGWSFGFRNAKDAWEERSGTLPLRKLTDFDMYEVSLIDQSLMPYYAATSVEVRAGEEIFSETRVFEDEQESTPQSDEKNEIEDSDREAEEEKSKETGYSRQMAENKIKILRMRGKRR